MYMGSKESISPLHVQVLIRKCAHVYPTSAILCSMSYTPCTCTLYIPVAMQKQRKIVHGDMHQELRHYVFSILRHWRSALLFPYIVLSVFSLAYMHIYLGYFHIEPFDLLVWDDYIRLPFYLLMAVFWSALSGFIIMVIFVILAVRDEAWWAQTDTVEEGMKNQERQIRKHFILMCVCLPSMLCILIMGLY